MLHFDLTVVYKLQIITVHQHFTRVRLRTYTSKYIEI